MSIVYVVQEPLHRVGREVEWRIPRRDLEAFGTIVCLCKWGELRDDGDGDFSPSRSAELWHKIRVKLRTFGDADYIVPLGNPALIAMATLIAADVNGGRVSMLDWVRDASAYRIIPIDAHCQPSSARDLARTRPSR